MGIFSIAKQLVLPARPEPDRVYAVPGMGDSVTLWMADRTGSGLRPIADTTAMAHVRRFGAKGDGISDDTPPIRAALDWLRSRGGGVLQFDSAPYRITSTIPVWAGIILQGNGKTDLWNETLGLGTQIISMGPGNPQQWTDVDGSDAADETPMFVAAGNGVFFRDLTLITNTDGHKWTRGLFYPCVKQCGFRGIQTRGFARPSVRLDCTWSSTNSLLRDLHPEIVPSSGMNEFTGSDFYLQSDVEGWEIAGTTRDPDAYATGDWLWSPAGASDVNMMNGRCTGYRLDAAIKNAAKAIQGIRITNVDPRTGSRTDMIYLDRVNRATIIGGYGEASSGNLSRVSLTSRTGAVLVLGGRYIRNQIWYDGVNTGRTLDTSNAELPQLTVLTDDGLLFSGDMAYGSSGLRSQTPGKSQVGTSGYPMARINTAELRGRIVTGPTPEESTDGNVRIRADGDYIWLNIRNAVDEIEVGEDLLKIYHHIAGLGWTVTPEAIFPVSDNENGIGSSSKALAGIWTYQLRSPGHMPLEGATIALIASGVTGLSIDAAGKVTVPQLLAVPPGPFADDAAAALGGIAISEIYRQTGGDVKWRQA